jgi:hypothetical protein
MPCVLLFFFFVDDTLLLFFFFVNKVDDISFASCQNDLGEIVFDLFFFSSNFLIDNYFIYVFFKIFF